MFVFPRRQQQIYSSKVWFYTWKAYPAIHKASRFWRITQGSPPTSLQPAITLDGVAWVGIIKDLNWMVKMLAVLLLEQGPTMKPSNTRAHMLAHCKGFQPASGPRPFPYYVPRSRNLAYYQKFMKLGGKSTNMAWGCFAFYCPEFCRWLAKPG